MFLCFYAFIIGADVRESQDGSDPTPSPHPPTDGRSFRALSHHHVGPTWINIKRALERYELYFIGFYGYIIFLFHSISYAELILIPLN